MNSVWTEIRDVFRWWMIPLAAGIIVLGLLGIISMSPAELLPHEYVEGAKR